MFLFRRWANAFASGGGNIDNSKLSNASVMLQWMVNQSAFAGLLVEPSKVVWDMDQLEVLRPTNSMTRKYSWLEGLPFSWLTYEDATQTTRYVVYHLTFIPYLVAKL